MKSVIYESNDPHFQKVANLLSAYSTVGLQAILTPSIPMFCCMRMRMCMPC